MKRVLIIILLNFISPEKLIKFFYKDKPSLWIIKYILFFKHDKTNKNYRLFLIRYAKEKFKKNIFEAHSNSPINSKADAIHTDVLKNSDLRQMPINFLKCYIDNQKLFNRFIPKPSILVLRNYIQNKLKDDHKFVEYELFLDQCYRETLDPKYMQKKAELYAANGLYKTALIFYKIAASKNSPFHLSKLFSFELEHGFPTQDTFSKLKKLTSASLCQQSPVLNRVKCFANSEQKSFIYKLLSYTKKNLITNKSIDLNKKVTILIRNREIGLAQQLINKNKKKISLKTRNLALNVFKDLTNIQFLTDIASINENKKENFVCWDEESKSTINLEDLPTSRNIIELAIPTVFFAVGETKPTYKTVKTFYLLLIEQLISNHVVIIPFHQFNWRKYNPSTNYKCISYHTFSDSICSQNLHIQESSIAGKVSADSKGFAGFSSLADEENYNTILNKLNAIPQEQVNETFQNIQNLIKDNSISKYSQTIGSFEISSPFVFIPMQIPTDIVSQLYYLSSMELVKNIIPLARKFDLKIVVKEHPYNDSSILDTFIKSSENNGDIILSNNSIHTIASSKYCKAVFTANSGAGLESLMHLVPVYVSGKADYEIVASGIIKNSNDLESIFTNGFSLNNQLVKRFLCYYMNDYTILANSENDINSKILTSFVLNNSSDLK